ncbi:MAG: HD domain-containing phosphohydrolase [Pseudomonadota bacterium]
MTQTNEKHRILVVDDAPENIDVIKGILTPEYAIRAATGGSLALKIIEKQRPDLILLDVMMPDMDGYEVCRILKAAPAIMTIPVIFVSALSEVEDEQKGFDMGAVDYITKPVQPAVIKARVRTHLALANQQQSCLEKVAARTQELECSQRAAIYMLGEAGHFNDTDTGVHIWRMAAYAGTLARAMHWPVGKAKLLELAAPMHDTGKIGIPDAILKAPRKLTPDEWEVMKTHAELGHRILSKSQTQVFQLAAEVALYHHEKWDGSGYPQGLSGEAIPESARIVAIADVFDALTMRRPYKEPWCVEKAIANLQQDAGTHFDPKLVRQFMDITPEILQIKAQWDNQEGSELEKLIFEMPGTASSCG